MRNQSTESGAVLIETDRTGRIRSALDSLLAGAVFAGAPKSGRLLAYLTLRTLAGEGDEVNEYAIGLDVFGKPASFDPRTDSAVRTGVARLRQRLRAHYEGAGRREAVRFEIPVRTYRVIVTFAEVPAPVVPAPRFRLARHVIAAAAILLAATLAALPAYHRDLGVDSLVVVPISQNDSGEMGM